MTQDDLEYTHFQSWTVKGFVHADLEAPEDLSNRNLKLEQEKLQNKSMQQHGKGSEWQRSSLRRRDWA